MIPVTEVRLSGPWAQTALAIDQMMAAAASSAPARKVGNQISQFALNTLRALTPLQSNKYRREGTKRGFPAFAKQWQVNVVTSLQSAYESQIFSKAAPPGTGDRDPGVIALASVEFGAKPHRMPRTGTKLYVWNERPMISRMRSAIVGGLRKELPGGRASDLGTNDIVDIKFKLPRSGRALVFTKAINHPGSPPFMMVATTQKLVDDSLVQFSQRLLDEYSLPWIRPSIATFGV